jgi:hypothetical protein
MICGAGDDFAASGFVHKTTGFENRIAAALLSFHMKKKQKGCLKTFAKIRKMFRILQVVFDFCNIFVYYTKNLSVLQYLCFFFKNSDDSSKIERIPSADIFVESYNLCRFISL